MSNPTLTFGQAVHSDLASLGTLSAIGRINVARIALARPHIADTGLVHGPARPTVADVAALYASHAARGAFLIPLLRIARDA
jgi:acyl-coenzyme A thioesterase PaaI-like protein